jgi:hypothetical protein
MCDTCVLVVKETNSNKDILEGWGRNSVVEHLPRMYEALGSTNTKKRENIYYR